MTEPEERAGWQMHAGFVGNADAKASSAKAFCNARAEVGTGHGNHHRLALWVGCLTKVAGPWLTAALILMRALATNPVDVG